MNIKTQLILGLVPVLNIAFNTLARKAGTQDGTFISGIFSPLFGITLLVGTVSAIALFTLYREGESLARGILLMGAGSVLLGTIWGLFWGGGQLHSVEIALLVTLAGFYVARFIYVK